MDEYTVQSVLGEGSFGRVLLVHHKNTSQKYAMKEIRLPKSNTQKSWNESILLAKMKHPNIVTYKESFEVDGHLYIVMEFCDDGDLLQKIKRQKGKLFPEDMILNWFTQICLGVKYIHDRHVLHRDIKSKNILLTQNGKVKLGDFGSALLLTSPKAYACSYVGTPYYVPPEIWENTPYNNKSDIWSLGCILYELCTLKHPFQASSWKHLILKICNGYFSPLPSHYSYELQYLIKQMFKKDPRNRPSASTILNKNCLAKLIRNFDSAENDNNVQNEGCRRENVWTVKNHEETLVLSNIGPVNNLHYGATLMNISNDYSEIARNLKEGKHARLKTGCSEPELISKGFSEMGLGKTVRKSETPSEAALPRPHRRQWEKEKSSTLVNALDKVPLLSSSVATKEDEGGQVRKYGGKITRKQWTKEPPETVLHILHNADISLAFKTYTIYKAASDDLLRGPLTEETKRSDETDGEIMMEDPERLESRSDEEDTDFEAEDDPDWVFELKRIMNME